MKQGLAKPAPRRCARHVAVTLHPFAFVERKVSAHVLYKRVENHWRDTDVRVRGPIVEYLQGAFADVPATLPEGARWYRPWRYGFWWRTHNPRQQA